MEERDVFLCPHLFPYNPMFLYLCEYLTCLRTQESKIQLRSKATWAEVRDSNLDLNVIHFLTDMSHMKFFSFIVKVLIINFCNLPGSVHSSPVTDRIRFIPGLVWGHWADEKAVSKWYGDVTLKNFVRWYSFLCGKVFISGRCRINCRNVAKNQNVILLLLQ